MFYGFIFFSSQPNEIFVLIANTLFWTAALLFFYGLVGCRLRVDLSGWLGWVGWLACLHDNSSKQGWLVD